VSVDACQRTVVWLQLSATAVTPMGIDGGVESGQVGVVATRGALRADRLPELSSAAIS
jgi:hypothetical protein